MKINEVVKKIHECAIEKGWWEINKIRSALEIHALIHSEISEATEEVRNGNDYVYYKQGKPEGEPVELVDTVIRIFDYFAFKGWNFEKILIKKMEYNENRKYRHGGKKY